MCALPFGVTTAPNSYTATIAVGKAGAAGPTIAFAVTAGSLPPGLSLAPSSGSGDHHHRQSRPTGTFNFTIKATDGGLTSTLAYEITITVAGPPDQLLCDPADNGGFLISGICELPDAVIGLPYQGHLITSHKVGGTLSVVSGSLPPGLSLPAAFAGSGDTIGGTPPTRASNPTTPSPCTAPATRASPCTRSTRSWSTRTSRWPSPCRESDQPSVPGQSAERMRRTSS